MRIDRSRVRHWNFNSRFLLLWFIICKSKSITVLYNQRTTECTQQLSKAWDSKISKTWKLQWRVGVLRARFSETDAAWTWGSRMWSLDSMETASTAPNRDSPLEELEGAVEIGTVLEAEEHKQTKHMPVHDQCNNNFANWSKIDEVWWIWRFGVLEGLREFGKVSDLDFGEMKFCYA